MNKIVTESHFLILWGWETLEDLKMNRNNNMSTKLPVFDGKNWNRWMIQMRVLFGAQDVFALVTDGYILVAVDATEEEREAQRNKRKKD